MTLDSFFEKFELFAEAPNAVAKMRELILWQAFADTERSPTWDRYPLKELTSKIGSGSTPDGGRESYVDEGIPLIRSMNVHFDGFRDEGLVYLSEEQARKLSGVTVQQQDVLLNITGASIGRVTTAPQRMAGARVNQHVTIIRCREELGADYLAKFLASPLIQNLINEIQVGATRQALTKGMIEQFKIPLPPLAEQKRIVAKVDELMALCDRLEAQQKERETRHTALVQASLTRFTDAPTPTNLEFLFHKSYAVEPAELRKTILTLAVQGKLVFQDADDEPVERMLLRILAEQWLLKRTNISKIRTLAAADRLEYATPDSWQWVTLEDIMIFGPTNGISPKSVEHETPVRSLTLSATTSGRFRPEHCKYIPMELSFDSDLWLQDGDILVQRGNTIDYVGVAAVYHGTAHQFVYPDLMMKFRVSSEVDVDFIHLAMSSDPCRTFLRARASGTSGSMPKINQATLKSLPIPLPPLPEQKRIVAKVEELMGLVDRLEALLSESRERAARLMDAVVAEIARAA